MTTTFRNRNKRNQQPEQEKKAPTFIAWHVAERGEKAYWTRIGAAWDHKDGEGLTLQLDLVPVSAGRVVLRPPKAEEDQGKGA